MKDRWGRNDIGVRGLCEGERIVRNGMVKIGRELFEGECLIPLEGHKVIVRCKDCHASEYYVCDQNRRDIGVVKESTRLFGGSRSRFRTLNQGDVE